jgi:hypothetical protein
MVVNHNVSNWAWQAEGKACDGTDTKSLVEDKAHKGQNSEQYSV